MRIRSVRGWQYDAVGVAVLIGIDQGIGYAGQRGEGFRKGNRIIARTIIRHDDVATAGNVLYGSNVEDGNGNGTGSGIGNDVEDIEHQITRHNAGIGESRIGIR